MATCDAVGASFLEQTLARGGSQVEWRVAFLVDSGASQRLGAAESQRRTWAEMRAQGGGVVWRHGSVIGRIGNFMWILTLKIAWRFDGGDNFCSVYMRYSLSVC
jgi:hypothetical protein